MATKLQFYQSVAEQTVGALTRRRGNWLTYLDTAARLYKYPVPDQLMIYAQRPNAFAVAPIELWNEQFNRWVRRGSKGIALIDDTGHFPKLKYVFDVQDTEPSRYNARPVQLWELRQEHRPLVLAQLAKNYDGVSDTLADSFRNIAKAMAEEYYSDNAQDIQYRAENSFLEPITAYDFSGTAIEERDSGQLENAFVEALSNSIAYTLMCRCGLDTETEFEDEDFQAITDFDTPDMVYALGTATSELSKQVLHDVEITIRKYERVKAAQLAQNAERSNDDYDRNPYIQPSGGLSSPGHHADAAVGGNAARTLRADEESVPQRPQDNQLQPPVTDGEAVPAPAGGGRSGDGTARTPNDRVDGSDTVTRQGNGAAGVDGGDEHAESASGGNGGQRADLRIISESEPPQPPQVEPSELNESDSFALPETDETPVAAVRHRYYSTQRSISIGTYPRESGDPVEIQNFDTRTTVENGAFQAWGWLEYDKPLTDKQVRDYELRYVPTQLTIDRSDVTETFSPIGKSSIEELLLTSAITLAEVASHAALEHLEVFCATAATTITAYCVSRRGSPKNTRPMSKRRFCAASIFRVVGPTRCALLFGSSVTLAAFPRGLTATA
jgi:hypothetical protein